jgi:hypothetical protein
VKRTPENRMWLTIPCAPDEMVPTNRGSIPYKEWLEQERAKRAAGGRHTVIQTLPDARIVLARTR